MIISLCYFEYPQINKIEFEDLIFLSVWGPMYTIDSAQFFFDKIFMKLNSLLKIQNNQKVLTELAKQIPIETLEIMTIIDQFSDEVLDVINQMYQTALDSRFK